MKTVCILGSTGSVGVQSLEVISAMGWRVSALTGGKNTELMEKQAREFLPKTAVMADENAAADLRVRLADIPVRVAGGAEAIREAAAGDCDTVLNAIVGIAGILPTLAAIEAGHNIALANKETLVAGGDIVMKAAADRGVKILPVDSEHSAIFQCLQGIPQGSLRRILLTASGGPFFGYNKESLKKVTKEQALRHPNWDMGAKITIDSATLMNKGLEVIEAVRLFGVKPDEVEVLIHRQSIVHSAIELCDGAVIAQLGVPDMKLPIQYALTYPERKPCPSERLDLAAAGSLTFEKPDTETFGCLAACIDAVRKGGLVPATLSGANEVAVDLFLRDKINITEIEELVRGAADACSSKENYTIDDVLAADRAAREYVSGRVNG